MRAPLARLACAACAALTMASTPAHAQSVRLSGSTTLRYVEVRPLVRDSVPAVLTDGGGLLRQASDGRIVRCVPGEPYCVDVRPGARAASIPVIHDLEATAWGFGEGVRVYTQARVRTGLDEAQLWPRGDDAFDLLVAYVELDRTRVRVRLGRQWQLSGLGVYNFDGAAVALRPLRGVTVEGYAGRSLVRGLNERRSGGALESIEPLAPSSSGVLLGVNARYRPHARLSMGAAYQLELRTDGGGRYGELAIADAAFRVRGAAIHAGVEIDVAGAALNEARLRLQSPPLGPFLLHAEARRYRPYFELWTIWGAFSPVGFDELRGGAMWSPDARIVIRADAGYRRYPPLEGGLADLRTEGWTAAIALGWTPTAAWQLDGAWRIELVTGAARREAQAALTRRLGAHATIALHGVVFQRLYEFRLDESTVAGIGAEAAVRISERLRAVAGATAYRHLDGAAAGELDWTQRRALLRLEWVAGAEPRVRAPEGAP